MILLNHSIVNIGKTIVVSWVECTDVYISIAWQDEGLSWSHGSWIYNYLSNKYILPQSCEFQSHSGVMYLIKHYIIMSYCSYHTTDFYMLILNDKFWGIEKIIWIFCFAITCIWNSGMSSRNGHNIPHIVNDGKTQ